MFERDGYHIERWPEIKNMAHLTEGHYNLIILDINGIGLNESPDEQGLGILTAIKKTNPAQSVLVYSARKQNVTASKVLERADAVMDKGDSYVNFSTKVNDLLVAQSTPDYFIGVINSHLGPSAALAPKTVPLALRALSSGNAKPLRRYLQDRLPDREQIETIAHIVTIGSAVLSGTSGI